MNIREKIIHEIKDFIALENQRCRLSGHVGRDTVPTLSGHAGTGADPDASNLWQEPLVGFADVNHPYIRNLRKTIHPHHQMPEEVIPDASVIIVYFVPFREWLTQTNQNAGLASPEWAESYEITNAMFGRLNEHIISVVHKLGYKGAIAPEAGVFRRDEVTSRWSFRHIAYAAGLGTFGLNNMLITEKGCAGRINTVVTNLPVEAVSPGAPQEKEACLYKRIRACRLCQKTCPVQAIGTNAYDRRKCFDRCLENAAVYTAFGSSYASAPGEEADAGSEVCGKCLSGLPCTYKIP